MATPFWQLSGPCPRRDLHYPDQPKGYAAWLRWQKVMSQTHVQGRCPVCGVFDVWTPRSPHQLPARRASARHGARR